MVRIYSLRQFSASKYGRIAGILVIVGVAVATIYLFSRSRSNLSAPTYDVLLPQRTAVEDLGGWRRVTPEDSDPAFAYEDAIDSISIRVTQQPMPPEFAGNVAASIKELAKSYSATTVIEAGGTDVYIGRSARGPQSVIFARGDTLILIKSDKTISQAEWIKYINNLVDPKSEQTPTF